MHSLNLGWFLQKFNELREDWATAEAGINGALDAEIQRAEDALSDVFDARDAAAASATAAAGSASAAGTSATAAQNSATGAASSATLANQKATAAGLSEAAAAQSATQAGNSATAAAGSATAAGQSATNAAASETAAGQSASAAAGSATAAGNSATAAAGSATAAEASAVRAEQVEQSIPEDYSELSADVEEIKEELTTINNLYYKTQNLAVLDESYKPATIAYSIFKENHVTGTAPSAMFVACWKAQLEANTDYIIQGNGRNCQLYVYTDSIYGNRLLFSALDYTPSQRTFNSGEYTSVIIAIYATTGALTFDISNIQITKGTTDRKTYSEEYSFIDFIARTAIAPVIYNYTAQKNLTTNDIIFVNDNLYRITQNINAGSLIEPGINAVETSLAELLKPLIV